MSLAPSPNEDEVDSCARIEAAPVPGVAGN